jgi:hypothetical protein
MQLKPAAQSLEYRQGLASSVPAGWQRVMAWSPSQPTSHLEFGPHADAPFDVISLHGFAQYVAKCRVPAAQTSDPVQVHPAGQSASPAQSRSQREIVSE